MSGPFWATISRLERIGKEDCRSRTAQSSPGSHGASIHRRKTTKPLAVANLSLRELQRTEFNLWSRTQKNTPRPAGGVTLISTKANLLTRHSCKAAFAVTRRSNLATISSRVTHL